MKLSTLILILLALASPDSFAGGRRAPKHVETPNTSPSVTPSVTPSPVVSHGGVTFEPVAYYTTPAERVKILSAGVKLNQVIQSQCFYDFMSARKLIQTNGRTAAQVATHLQGLTGVVPVNMYYRRFTSAVAYRQPPSMAINLNRRNYTTGVSDCEWGSVLGHESLGHSLGNYEHDFNWNSQRDFSVPYSINKAFTVCCK